jgi:hypothetical protein
MEETSPLPDIFHNILEVVRRKTLNSSNCTRLSAIGYWKEKIPGKP